MDRYRIVFIIPAFNEEMTIGKIVQSLKKYGEVVVVDDASNDLTALHAKSNGAVVLKNAINQGYNQSLNIGFSFALENGYDFGITWDADDQFDLSNIYSILPHLSKEVDAVIGYRTDFQRLSEHICAYFFNILWRIKDPLCGLKAFNLSKFTPATIIERSFSINTDKLLLLLKNNSNIAQFHVKIKEREGHSRFGTGIKPNYKILKCLLFSLLLSR